MADMKTFQQRLAEGVLVFDGAMGTEIYQHHIFTNRCFDELCLSDAELIRRIHREYCDAGADVLTTNTFGANRVALGQFGLAEKLHQINCEGAQLARQVADAADRQVFVAGSIGPLPPQPRYEDSLAEMVDEQATALIDGGADVIIFETLHTRKAMLNCARAMQAKPGVPFILSFAILDNGESVAGEPVGRMLAPFTEELPMPVAWGLNCGTGPDGLIETVQRAVQMTALPLVIQPNAGVPKLIEGETVFSAGPSEFAQQIPPIVDAGANFIGGCCGSTPQHIRAVAEILKG